MVGSTQVHIRIGEFFKVPIKVPINLKEQQKIASCLSAVDELITAQAVKIEQLQQHKKGLMQGLFPKMAESQIATDERMTPIKDNEKMTPINETA